MPLNNMESMTSAQLKEFIATHNEKDYAIIDVRQAGEYYNNHIPGARLIPFTVLGKRAGELPEEKDIIFTCLTGARSKAAAAIAFDLIKKPGRIINHKGGLISWEGRTVQDFPKVQALGLKKDFDEVLLTAMDLEKGAWNFYKSILEKFPGEPFSDAIEYLSMAESDHAEALYRILIKRKEDLPDFDSLFLGMKGDILEGGVKLEDALAKLDQIESPQPLAILEMALDIEYSAFDLYRNGADMTSDPEIKKILYSIANGEKNHMKKLSEAFEYLE